MNKVDGTGVIDKVMFEQRVEGGEEGTLWVLREEYSRQTK